MADARESLEKLLGSLGEAFEFAAVGSRTPVLPGLEVKGVGTIGFPVSTADAKRLIGKATQAPYGRGEETIVDTNVRCVWQIDAAKLSFRNAEWREHIAEIVDDIRLDLRIRHNVTPQLYKLLVYEKGSFFAPHRDSEKNKGMFATLVVCLPSLHQGGTLIVTHDGLTKKIDFGGKDAEFKIQYAAFYADCQHEITPVTAGYRVCLVYNLSISGKSKQPSAPSNVAAIDQAARFLVELFANPSSELDKLAIPFEYQYTETGLDPRQLKGADRARAEVLVRAAESLGYQCYLALLTHHQSGEVDYETLGYDRYHSRRSYGWSRDEENEDDDDDSGAEMGEVNDESLTLDHWLDPQGKKQSFGEMQLVEEEILSQAGKDHWSIRQEIHEATGNAGVSMERWYRQGVMVIWPSENNFRILAKEGQTAAIPTLEKMTGKVRKSAALEPCRALAAEIVARWRPHQRMASQSGSYSTTMLDLLERIGDADLAVRFVREIIPKDFDGSEGKALRRLCDRFGWELFAAPLREFANQQKPEDYYSELAKIVSVCEFLCCEKPGMTDEQRTTCVELANELSEVIERWDADKSNHWHRSQENRAGVVAGVVHVFAVAAAIDRLDQFVVHVLADKSRYGLHEVLIPDVKAIFQWIATSPEAQPAAHRLLQHCIAELQLATAAPIEPPNDWTRDARLTCKCQDCREINRFLRDPTQQVGRFPLRKERRQHLHNEIDRHHCDLTHVTERVGSPQTLVCTKTLSSYERRAQQYEVDRSLLSELESIARGNPRAKSRRSATRKSAKK